MKQFVSATLSVLLLTLVAAAHAAERPNILLIVADDMGYADVGFHGCKDIPTPNLDALAASGARFTNAYVTGPYCSPTRAGLLAGKYQQRFGFEYNTSRAGTGLPVSETTLADRLKSAGYVTSLVGKWHLGTDEDKHPQRRGFDEFFGFLGGAHSFFSADNIVRGDEPVREIDYTTYDFGREAMSFVERQKGKPWFLDLSFNAVHTPMQAPEELVAKFANISDRMRRTYAAMMSAMDTTIGEVLAKLRETGQEQNTLVIFVNDNGGPTMPGVTVNGASNEPLRGSKRTTLEGGIRVPFVVSWAGKLKPAVYDEPVIQLDIHTTALAVAGVELTPELKLDGKNLMPLLMGQPVERLHDALYWRLGQQMAIRVGDYKLVRYDSNADTLTGKRNQPITPARLYNLKSDIGETKDLASEMPEKVRQLQAKWDAWNATLMQPLWGNPVPTSGSSAEGGKRAGRESKNQQDR